MWVLKFVVLVLITRVIDAIVVDLPDGQVEGITGTTLAGTTFHSFLALRYAQPPVGALRFKPPLPVKSWDEIYDGTAEKNVCYQLYEDSYKENEDCLFVNVFTPVDLNNLGDSAPLPVMVWIHGGAFISGAAYMNEGGVGPKFFMDEKVLLVSINYRLGPFGFLSTGDVVLPGNLGLKDQVLALKWVQKNIRYFGGDADKVTIFGQSAGSASCSYQLLSPQSRGLFRSAILESGAALSPWGFQRNQAEYTYKTAQIIDPTFTSRNSTELLQFLQSVPASAIDNASSYLAVHTETPDCYQISKGFFYSPVIEISHDDAFLTEPQYELFLSGNYTQVPVLFGMTNEESLGLLESKELLPYLWNANDADPSTLVPFDLHVTDPQLIRQIGEEIINFFTDSGKFNGNLTEGIMYHSMQDFDKANIKQAELMSKYSSVYFYEFSYHGPMGYFTYDVPGAGNTTHAEEVNYFFSKWYSYDIPDNTNLTYFPESDRNVHYRIMSLWTNFVKYLNPTPPNVDVDILQNIKWEPVKPDSFRYLNIGQDLSMVRGYPKEEKYLFWFDLYNKYAVRPLDTF